MTLSVTTVGPILAAYSTDISAEFSDAFSLSLCWAEAVARIADTDVASEVYFSALCAELGRISWIVTDAGTEKYDAKGGATNAAQAVENIAGQYMPKGSIKPLTEVLKNIASSDPNAKLGSFLTTWWDSLDQSVSAQIFATSPLIIDANGQLTTTISYMNFSSARTDWQSFFVSDVSDQTDIEVRHVNIALNWDLWIQIRADIEKKLGARARKAIRNIDLDL